MATAFQRAKKFIGSAQTVVAKTELYLNIKSAKTQDLNLVTAALVTLAIYKLPRLVWASASVEGRSMALNKAFSPSSMWLNFKEMLPKVL